MYKSLVTRKFELAQYIRFIQILDIGKTKGRIETIVTNNTRRHLYVSLLENHLNYDSTLIFVYYFFPGLPTDNPKLAFAITGAGLPDTEFALVRHVVATAAKLYKQLGSGRNIQMSSGIIGYDGFYPCLWLASYQ
jgi:hypothetical protein